MHAWKTSTSKHCHYFTTKKRILKYLKFKLSESSRSYGLKNAYVLAYNIWKNFFTVVVVVVLVVVVVVVRLNKKRVRSSVRFS